MALILTNKKRVCDKIINLITEDKLTEVKSLLSYLGDYKKYEQRFIKTAIIHCSQDCSDFFLNEGVTISLNNIFRKCKFNKFFDVYEFCNKLSEKYNIIFSITKDSLIERLLDPYKVDTNPERVDYFLNLIDGGFLTISEAILFLHNNSKGKNTLKRILRELKLQELGI